MDASARPVGFTLALALHSLLAAAVLVKCAPPPLPPPPTYSEEREVQPMEAKLIPASEAGLWPCPKRYRGMGLMGYGGTVYSVVDNGPAWKAGIREGDEVTNLDDFYPDQYEVGEVITLIRVNGTRRERIKLTIDWICRD